jgi:hypothetical protein
MFHIKPALRRRVREWFARCIDEFDTRRAELNFDGPTDVDRDDDDVPRWINELIASESQERKLRRGRRLVRERTLSVADFLTTVYGAADDNNINNNNNNHNNNNNNHNAHSPLVGVDDDEFQRMCVAGSVRLCRSRKDTTFYVKCDVVVSPLLGRAPTGIASVDPGGRKMLTIVDVVAGNVVTWGHKRELEAVNSVQLQIDDLQSRMTERTPDDTAYVASHHRRNKMRHAKLRLFQRQRDMIKDLHRKLAKFLCESYSVILLPEFKTSGMLPRVVRSIPRPAAVTLLTWKHFDFRQALIKKAARYPHVKLVIVDESYTTKTCHQCSTVRDSFAGETFHCTNDECRFTCDRDVNAGVNILLKYLTEHCAAAAEAWLQQRQQRQQRQQQQQQQQLAASDENQVQNSLLRLGSPPTRGQDAGARDSGHEPAVRPAV